MTSSLSAFYIDDRAEFSSEHDERYAFGDPGAPLLVLNAVDDDGCVWVADVPEGWDAPTVDTPLDRRPSGHGAFAGEPTFEARPLTWEGTVTAPSAAALKAAENRWRTALLGSIPGYVRYTHLDDEPARGLWLLPAGKPKWRAFDDRAADFSMVMVAEDPIKTGDAVLYGPVRLPVAGGEGGYTMPLTMPLTASGATVGVTVVTVANPGDEASHVVYTVTGPIPQPIIALSTGEFVRLNADLGAFDTWIVDTAAGTSTVNGVNRYDAWGAGSTFPLIPPGGAELRLRSALGGADQTAALTALTAPSWK